MKKYAIAFWAFIEALIETFKRNILNRRTCKLFLAYGCIIAVMKHGETLLEDRDCWNGELPSIWNLDDIVDAMNDLCEDINATFKLDVSEWKREEVKIIMNSFQKLYDDFCEVNNKQLHIAYVLGKLNKIHKESFVECFKAWYAIKKKEHKPVNKIFRF